MRDCFGKSDCYFAIGTDYQCTLSDKGEPRFQGSKEAKAANKGLP